MAGQPRDVVDLLRESAPNEVTPTYRLQIGSESFVVREIQHALPELPNDTGLQRRAREGGAKRRPMHPAAATPVWVAPAKSTVS